MGSDFSIAYIPQRSRLTACASETRPKAWPHALPPKEAGAKALGTGISRGVNWLEIEVAREPGGRPTLRFHGRAAEIAARLGVVHTALSITHTSDTSMANVILEDGR